MKTPLWEFYSGLVKMVRDDHKKANSLVGGGHDFSHALMVAQYCLKIVVEPVASLGWIAGICHNTDRLFPDWTEQQIRERIEQYLTTVFLLDTEKQQIMEAVLNHSKRPSPDDNPVTVVLMDADKLANLGYLLVIRSAQFQPNLPAINLRYFDEYPPGCNYRKPGSIYRDIFSCLEWEGEFEQGGKKYPWIRTLVARELAKPLLDQIRQCLIGITQQFHELGLIPYPFSEDFS